MIRKIEPSERQIQCAIVEWANNTMMKRGKLKIGSFLLKIPNEGKRSLAYGARMKKEGMKKGVSDLFLACPIPRMGYQVDFYIKCGLWLEIKSNKGKLSMEQIEWITLMNIAGYEARCVDSVDEGIQAIKDYLGIK